MANCFTNADGDECLRPTRWSTQSYMNKQHNLSGNLGKDEGRATKLTRCAKTNNAAANHIGLIPSLIKSSGVLLVCMCSYELEEHLWMYLGVMFQLKSAHILRLSEQKHLVPFRMPGILRPLGSDYFLSPHAG